jgi:hypothetical protein
MVKRDEKSSFFFYPDIYNKLYSMIKQTWEISNEERNRILSLHESATKNHYLMSEQGHNLFTGPGSSSYVLDQDQDYMYFISQVTYGVTATRINWKRPYQIYAMNNDRTFFRCETTGTDEKGMPIGVTVLTDKPLPKLSKNPDTNEFKIGLKKLSKKTWEYTPGDELTINGLIGEETEGLIGTGRYLYGVVSRGRPATTVLDFDDKSGRFNKEYDINFNELEVGSVTYFNPDTEGFYKVRGGKISGRFSAFLVTTFSGQQLDPEFFDPDDKPDDDSIPTPTPPAEPVPLGDKFANNISQPNRDAILNDPNFIKFKKFVEGNDMSKFVFVIESSASKCTAGYKEANSAEGKWSDDKDNYPDVVIDSDADKNDLGNLNLTKARAQNLKNFLIANLPKLKNAKFEVIAQGSKGICGTEEENRKYRQVNLTVRKL